MKVSTIDEWLSGDNVLVFVSPADGEQMKEILEDRYVAYDEREVGYHRVVYPDDSRYGRFVIVGDGVSKVLLDKPGLGNGKVRPVDFQNALVEVGNNGHSLPIVRYNRFERFVRGVMMRVPKRGVGKVVDIVDSVVGLPLWVTRLRRVLLKTKPEEVMPKRFKPFLKQKSTWEGVALLLGAVGVYINPAAIVEIVMGVFAVIGGIELWKKEEEGE